MTEARRKGWTEDTDSRDGLRAWEPSTIKLIHHQTLESVPDKQGMSAQKFDKAETKNSLNRVQVSDPGDPAEHVASRNSKPGVEDEDEDD